MWLPSFWSVIGDLWRFVFGGEPLTENTVRQQEHSIQNTALPAAIPKKQLLVVETAARTAVTLTPHTTYTATDSPVQRIRARLGEYDEHLVTTGNLTLVEWLLFTIHVTNPSIVLLALKMTPIGRWHQTLRGLSSVHIGIEPATGSLMEWQPNTNNHQAALVTKVTPDLTLTYQTIDVYGTCTEVCLTKNKWRPLGPVFTRFWV